MAKPAIIVISSHVVRGTVGNRAAVFALEALGFPVWAVPTVTLPWHPGHGPATRIVPPNDAFANMLGDLERAPWLGEVGGVLTGYLGDAGQAGPVARLVEAVKARNPAALHVCDPVIGDRGGLYVGEATAEAIRDLLLPLSDIATPNRYELDWLTGRVADDVAAMLEAARKAGPAAMVVTSAPAGRGRIGNLLVECDGAWLAAHELVERPPNGLGDMTAALILAHRLDGLSPRDAVARTTGSVFDCLVAAVARGSDELMLETDADLLRTPRTRPTVKVIDGEPATVCVGVDGCKAGWIAVARHPDSRFEIGIHRSFDDLITHYPDDAIIAVDMPIGLPERIEGGGRGPEMLVRRHLGPRQSSVFAIPSRAAVHAATDPFTTVEKWYDDHRKASDVARATSTPPRGVSIQTFALFSKIREIDALLIARPELRRRIIESHPEAAFWRLNGEQHMSLPKKVKGRVDPAGMDERRTLLARCGIDRAVLDAPCPRGAGTDDFLDACAMLLIAERFAAGEATPFPDPPLEDAHGVPIAIWT